MEDKNLLYDNLNKCTKVAEFLSAISNPTRIAIVCYLTTGEKTVKEIVEALKMPQPTVSLNLHRLYLSGWVKKMKVKRNVYYMLSNNGYEEILRTIGSLFYKKKPTKK